MRRTRIAITALAIIVLATGCMTSSKLDNHVSQELNGQLPKPEKKKFDNITIKSALPESQPISETKKKTSKVIPAILYIAFDYRHTCTLNTAYANSYFTKAVYAQASKGLTKKLNGRQLEITLEQVPHSFAIVDKEKIILIFIHSSHVFVEPDKTDLVASYKVLDNGSAVKTGTLTMNNTVKNRDVRFFQSWKSSASEFLVQYNQDITVMAKDFVEQLEKEL